MQVKFSSSKLSAWFSSSPLASTHPPKSRIFDLHPEISDTLVQEHFATLMSCLQHLGRCISGYMAELSMGSSLWAKREPHI